MSASSGVPTREEILTTIRIIELGQEQMKKSGVDITDYFNGVLTALKWATGQGKNPIQALY